MDIQKYIDSYTKWLKNEITFSKIGEYYEINTPFLSNDNDYLQLYVKQDGDTIFFTDDGYTLNDLEMNGVNLSQNRKQQLDSILMQYGVHLSDKELTLQAPAGEFAQRKHAFVQCMLRVNDMYMTSKAKATSFFLDDIQNFFMENNIYYMENIQFTGKSGFLHAYDFALQRSKNKPERLCLAINNPTKTAMERAIFSWSDTKPSRRADSQLIVFLNDDNTIAKGIESGFSNYDAKTIRWSQRLEKDNLSLLTA